MGIKRLENLVISDSVRVTNPGGRGRLVLTCDHASNYLPPEFGKLGLQEEDLIRHIAWDPGALQVARLLAEALDAVLVETCISRLVLDCNRPLDAPDLIPPVSETTPIPGNAGISDSERTARIERCWKPFHETVERLLEERVSAGRETWLMSVHSFNPIYKGVMRPWQIGIIHDEDTRLAAPFISALEAQGSLSVGINEPYSPADRVYFTLEQHARPRGLPCAMVEIRNDEIADEAGQARWAELLAGILSKLKIGIDGESDVIPKAGGQHA